MSLHSISTLEPLQQTVYNKSLGSLTGQSAPTLHSRDPWMCDPFSLTIGLMAVRDTLVRFQPRKFSNSTEINVGSLPEMIVSDNLGTADNGRKQ